MNKSHKMQYPPANYFEFFNIKEPRFEYPYYDCVC